MSCRVACCGVLVSSLIAVPKPIESLSIGDFVVTTRGEKPVQWIGRQHFTQGRSARWPDSVHPICVSRSAVNGISITRAVPKGMRAIGYFHIELETHEVILAEGGLVETLLLTSGRESFSNFVEYERLYGPDTYPAITIAELDGYGGPFQLAAPSTVRSLASTTLAMDLVLSPASALRTGPLYMRT